MTRGVQHLQATGGGAMLFDHSVITVLHISMPCPQEEY